MGNHRAERGPRRAPSADRASRKPLITRNGGAAPAPQLEVVATEAPEISIARPSVDGPSRAGKRAARPERAPRAARTTRATSTTTKAIKPAVEVTPTISRAALDQPLPGTGKRRASRGSGSRSRSPLFKGLPSAPILAGVAALAVSAGGAVTAGPSLADSPPATTQFAAASAITGTTELEIVEDRTAVISRDSRREARTERVAAKLQAKAEAAAQERTEELQTLTVQAEKQAAKIEANRWVMPISGYRLSATFGMSSSLWSTVHTGLDFAAPSGTPLLAVANGVITEVGWDGSYGNKTVLTLEDGTEIWYCHQTSMDVSVGEEVVGGEVIGTVGSTGNSTGPHLHLEIRPSGDRPIDPYSALMGHGLQP